MSKALLAWLLAACTFAAQAAPDPAAADKPAKAPTSQQAKMKECSTTAKAEGKKGEERKAFMKTCLSKKA